MVAEIKSCSFWRAVLAELLGMTVFVFIGLAAAIGNKNNADPDEEVKVALAFGLAIATLVQSLGHISGAHLNPAITLGLLVTCQISLLRALFYTLAQMLGAVLASAIVYGIKPTNIDSLGLNQLNGISPVQGFGIEFLLTLQLVLCVIATTDKRQHAPNAPLAIGLSVTLGNLAGISYTGCGMNPARSFGPAVIMEHFQDHWVYWAGPMTGGVAAALIYDFLLHPRSEVLTERLKMCFAPEPEVEGPDQEALLGRGGDAAGQGWSKQDV